jgi:hypothetical protein
VRRRPGGCQLNVHGELGHMVCILNGSLFLAMFQTDRIQRATRHLT